MEKKIFILGLYCLLFAVFSLSVAAENIPVNKNWKEDTDRSLPAIPTISKEGNTLFIYSEKTLEGAYIAVTTTDWRVVYEETATVSAGVDYPVSIDDLPRGTYYITLMQGTNYLYGLFTKE